MLSPERHDVDIKKLFEWKSEVTVRGLGNSTATVYMRLIGDADWDRARINALRASGKLRAKLYEKDSDERLAYIPVKEAVDKETIIMLIGALQIRDMKEDFSKSIILEFPKEPKADASLEEQENYQKEVDMFEQKRLDAIESLIINKLETEKKKLRKRTLDELFDYYEKLVIDELCNLTLNKTFVEYSVYYGTFKDEELTERLFSSFEEFDNSARPLKEQLIEAYVGLDIGIYDLKK